MYKERNERKNKYKYGKEGKKEIVARTTKRETR